MTPDLDYLVRIATHAGEILMEGYLQQHEIRHKGRIDLVTEMDGRSEQYLLGEIRRDFKSHTFVTEESGILQGIQELVL
jgi:myo-inositol-1(or 4)-monophosphatase